MTTETFQYTPRIQDPNEAKYNALVREATRLQYHGYLPPTTRIEVTEEDVKWVTSRWDYERGVYHVEAHSEKRWAVTTKNPYKGHVGWYTAADRLILGLDGSLRKVEKATFATRDEALKFHKRLAKRFAERLEIHTVSEQYRDFLPALAGATVEALNWPTAQTVVGDTVRVKGFGKIRCGVAIKTAKTRVLVAYVTPSNPTEIHTAWEKHR